MNRGRNGKKDVRLFLRPGKPEKANNLIINSLWIVFLCGMAPINKQGRVLDPVKKGYTDINWEKEWKKRAIYFWGYQGINAFMIDFRR